MDKEIIKSKFWFSFRKTEDAQTLFNELLLKALIHKYPILKNKFILPIDGKTITEAIFGLNNKDQIKIEFKSRNDSIMINGQDFKELFIALIYARFLRGLKKWGDVDFTNKNVVLVKAEDDSDIDFVIAAVDQFQIDSNKIDFSKSYGVMFYSQIKEYYEDNTSEVNILEIQQIFNFKNFMKKLLEKYGNIERLFFIVFIRSFEKIDSKTIVKDNLEKEILKRCIFIGPLLFLDKNVLFNDGFEFFVIHGSSLVNNQDILITVKFNFPSYLKNIGP
jgi:hypothetical protein